MKNKFKERLIKLSYNLEGISIVGIVIMSFTLMLLGLATFFISNLDIRLILMNVAIFIVSMCSAFLVTLQTIREYLQGEIIFKNKLETLLLANAKCVREYIFVVAMVGSMLINNSIIGLIFMIAAIIAYFIMPKRISRHFKEKIIK